MGNIPSICGVDGGVIINDNGTITCYTHSRVINVINLQSIQSSKNTSIQAYTDINGGGTLVPLNTRGYNTEPIKSIVITVHWTRESIIMLIIIVIIITLLIGYGLWHGQKYFNRRSLNTESENYTRVVPEANYPSRDEINQMPSTESEDYVEVVPEANYPGRRFEGGEYVDTDMSSGYFSINY
jgi:hypothetical protein